MFIIYSWKERKFFIIALIKNISKAYGGDDPAFLDIYIAEVIEKWKDNMQIAQECFQDVFNYTRAGAYGYAKLMDEKKQEVKK